MVFCMNNFFRDPLFDDESRPVPYLSILATPCPKIFFSRLFLLCIVNFHCEHQMANNNVCVRVLYTCHCSNVKAAQVRQELIIRYYESNVQKLANYIYLFRKVGQVTALS